MLLGGSQGQPTEVRVLPLHRGEDWGVKKQAVNEEDGEDGGAASMRCHLFCSMLGAGGSAGTLEQRASMQHHSCLPSYVR